MIENVHATGAILTSSITGIPGHEVQDVSLSNIRIDTDEAGKAAWMEKPVPEQIKAYPEARMFDRLPSYGFYCRHVAGLKFENVGISTSRPDERPALHFEDVQGLHLDRVDVDAPATPQPLVRLIDVQDAVVTACTAPAHTSVAVTLEGAATKGVRLVGNDFSRAKTPYELRGGAAAPTSL
jgi:hypothetical protein